MQYIIITILLFALELIYFRVADKYNIIDKPNHRSSHTQITLRGGGIIFPFAFLLFLGWIFYEFSVNSNFSYTIFPKTYAIFGIGLLSLSAISFLDDIVDLSSKIRLAFHFLAVTLLIYFLGLFSIDKIWIIPIVYILVIGILNAYNFMDGINGITGIYTLVALVTFWFVNNSIIHFVDDNFIMYPIIASLVFLFFNFRKRAKCFAGDVGSMSIAIWFLALLGLAIIKTEHYQYLLFLLVYGLEVVFTIIQRIKLKENIFEAHRHHLYQLLANQMKWSHLTVSALYGFLQIIINAAIIYFDLNFWQGLLFLAIPLSLIYIYTKYYIFKKTGAY